MNFSNIICSHSTFPPLHYNQSLLPNYPPLKIPAFPKTKSASPLIGSKRPNPHGLDTTSIGEMESGKRIKMDSFNMLFKADFTERDPYMTRNEDLGESNKQKNGRKSIVCQPNKTTIKENGMTINISISKKPAEQENKGLSLKTEEELKLPENLTHFFPAIKAGADLKEAVNKETSLEGFEPLCQALEKECFHLWGKMHDLFSLSQMLRNEPFKVPSIVGSHSEDTRPGTPDISPKSLPGRRIDIENFKREVSENKSQERKANIDGLPLKDITKTLNHENQFECGASKKISNNQKGSGFEQKPKKKKEVMVEESTKVFYSNKKAQDYCRRKNRLQMLKAEREQLEDEIAKPYFISLHSQDCNLSQRVVFTRVGEAYQVPVPSFSLNDVPKRSFQREMKVKASPEMGLNNESLVGSIECLGKIEACEGDAMEI